MRGKYFEELKVGQRWRSPWKKITQSQIDKFARISGDKNPLHLDAGYAKQTIFGRRIAHGLFGLSMATGLIDKLGILRKTIVAFGGLQWKFVRPIYPGERIRAIFWVEKKRSIQARPWGVVTFSARLEKFGKKVAQEGNWDMIFQRRQPSRNGRGG